MIAGDAPFRLSEGLVLERSGVLLPWDAEDDDLRRLGSPLPGGPWLVWRYESVLGGLVADIRVFLSLPRPHTFFLDPNFASLPVSAREVYPDMVSELEERFGPPHASTVDEQLWEPENYPWIRWLWKDVTLSLRIQERFGESIALCVGASR
jgi:hypothetical protein